MSSSVSSASPGVECSLDTGGAVTRDRRIVSHSAVTALVPVILFVTGGASAEEESPTETLRYWSAIGGQRSLIRRGAVRGQRSLV